MIRSSANDAGVKIGCDKDCFCWLMLKQCNTRRQYYWTHGWRYKFWHAPNVMKFAAWGLVRRAAGVILSWMSGTEWKYFIRFWRSVSIDWTHLTQFVMCKEYDQDGQLVIDWTWALVCSVNDWTPLVLVVYVCMNRCGVTTLFWKQ